MKDLIKKYEAQIDCLRGHIFKIGGSYNTDKLHAEILTLNYVINDLKKLEEKKLGSRIKKFLTKN